MHAPGPNLERFAAWSPPASSDRLAKTVAITMIFFPAILAITGNVIADFGGPAITVLVWTVIFILRMHRGRNVYPAEWFAILSCLVILQLLLDLHTRHLGDIVIGALHLLYFGAMLLDAARDRIRCIRARRRDHEQL